MRTRTSPPTCSSLIVARLGPTLEKREALFEVEGGGHAFERESELHHRKRHFGLNPDDDGLCAPELGSTALVRESLRFWLFDPAVFLILFFAAACSCFSDPRCLLFFLAIPFLAFFTSLSALLLVQNNCVRARGRNTAMHVTVINTPNYRLTHSVPSGASFQASHRSPPRDDISRGGLRCVC